MATKPIVQIIGSLNTDVVVVAPRLPKAGETLTADSYSVGAGGKGANQAVACGRAAFLSKTQQDIEVGIIGAVGANDTHVYSLLIPILKGSGVSTDTVLEIEGSHTGTSTILVEANGENRIMFYPGANYVGMQDTSLVLDLATRAGKQYPDVVVLQGEIPRHTTLALLDHFNTASNKTCVVFNPAPMYPGGLSAKSLHNLAVLVVNETECILLAELLLPTTTVLKSNCPESLSRTQLDNITENLLHEVQIRTVVVTLGSRGAYYACQSGVRGVIAGVAVKDVVNTTAAGDTFIGYFAADLARFLSQGHTLQNFDIKSAIENANRAAALCVQRPGSLQSVPFRFECQ